MTPPSRARCISALQEKAKQESIAYQNYLKDLMIREKLDESATEDIRKKQVRCIFGTPNHFLDIITTVSSLDQPLVMSSFAIGPLTHGMCGVQENEVWEKRDEVQRKQKHARDYLMKQVMEGRQMQMALKKLANQEEAVLEDAQVHITLHRHAEASASYLCTKLQQS